MSTTPNFGVSLCLILTLALQAMAQDSSAPQATQFLSPYLVPITRPTEEKTIDPSIPSAVPTTAQPGWNGDKPFITEMNAPHFPAPSMPAEMLEAFKPAARTAFNLRDVYVQELRMI